MSYKLSTYPSAILVAIHKTYFSYASGNMPHIAQPQVASMHMFWSIHWHSNLCFDWSKDTLEVHMFGIDYNYLTTTH